MDYVDADVDITSAYKAATLFDTGAHASFVGRRASKKESDLPAEGTRGARPALHYGVTGGGGVQQPGIRMCSLRFNFL